LFDEPNLLFSSPTLDLLLSTDRVADILKAFEPNQAITSVGCGKPRNNTFSMLFDSTTEMIGYPAIENMGPAGNNVDVIMMISLTHKLEAQQVADLDVDGLAVVHKRRISRRENRVTCPRSAAPRDRPF
jgi:hypothetical protein